MSRGDERRGMTTLPLEHVHLPPDDAADPASGVLVLHGRGADEEDLLPVARRLPGDRHVVSLRAPDRLMGGYTWYELDLSGGGLHGSQPDPEDFRRSLDLVAESLDAAVDAFGLDPDRVGLLGFSQGAITSLATLLERPGRVAWVAAHHGYLPESHADAAPDGLADKPAFVAAGEADEVIPTARGEAAADRLREMGAAVAFETFPTGHGIGGDELEAVSAFLGGLD